MHSNVWKIDLKLKLDKLYIKKGKRKKKEKPTYVHYSAEDHMTACEWRHVNLPILYYGRHVHSYESIPIMLFGKYITNN